MNNVLQGKVALVTGGAKRIGRAISLALAEAGSELAITYRASRAEALDAVAEITALGLRASAHRCDVTDPDQIRRMVVEVVQCHGRLDVLVNNAGCFESVALQGISVAHWDRMFAVNTRAPFLVAQACYPHLKSSFGCIVNVGSLGGTEPWATHGHYCASKAALHMLTKTMAKAWGPEVRVNCVAPGMIEMDGESFPQFAARTPLGRNGSAADVASAVLYLAGPASFVTGQVLPVDGGLGL